MINPMEMAVYNQKGEKTGSIKLAKEIFGLPWNPNLVHQVMESLRANLRRPFAHAKGRGEVRGGGKKPWRQKGTGRARHGSIRSPIWIGGGVTHGPTKERVYLKKINKKMKRKALFVSLSRKLKEKEIVVLDKIEMKEPKTKKAKEILTNLSGIAGFESLKRKEPSLLVLTAGSVSDINRPFRNLPKVKVIEARNLNLLDLLCYRYLILTKEAVKIILSIFLKS